MDDDNKKKSFMDKASDTILHSKFANTADKAFTAVDKTAVNVSRGIDNIKKEILGEKASKALDKLEKLDTIKEAVQGNPISAAAGYAWGKLMEGEAIDKLLADEPGAFNAVVDELKNAGKELIEKVKPENKFGGMENAEKPKLGEDEQQKESSLLTAGNVSQKFDGMEKKSEQEKEHEQDRERDLKADNGQKQGKNNQPKEDHSNKQDDANTQ